MPEDATTNLQHGELQPWKQSSLFEPTYWSGNPAKKLLLQGNSYSEIEQLSRFLNQQELQIELLEKASNLDKRRRKYTSFSTHETWATKWVACPIAYLFPSERREEWLGDLYEVNREMLHKGYPRWFVSLINIGRTVILVCSAIQIKLSDLLTLRVKKSN